jgi:hypothetical protein
MRAKNRSAGSGSSGSLPRKQGRDHISSGPAVAAYPIQIDYVRLSLAHRA